MLDMPTTCPITKVKVARFTDNCKDCHFYCKPEDRCRIISIDENLKKVLAILQKK
ncbi:MAG: hypothetical protein IIV46_01015 [Phascolarctobacterium sp.]|nr:hypothetical protein [Phascolarctobacterium sp.]